MIRSFPGGTGLTGTLTADPRLGPLQNNGGRTPTMAPLLGSPAIDGGDGQAVFISTDQRGFARRVGGRVDVGALEFAPAATTVGLSAPASAVYGGAGVLTATVSGAYPLDLSGGAVQFYDGRTPRWYPPQPDRRVRRPGRCTH